jgi:hypothetical protein
MQPLPRVADKIGVDFQRGQIGYFVRTQGNFALTLIPHGIDAFHKLIEKFALLRHHFNLLAESSA